MGAELIFLILIAVVLVFGFGVLLVSRSRVRRADRRGRAVGGARGATLGASTGHRGRAGGADEVVVEEPPGVLVEERPRLRDRVGKARAALTGALLGVRPIGHRQ